MTNSMRVESMIKNVPGTLVKAIALILLASLFACEKKPADEEIEAKTADNAVKSWLSRYMPAEETVECELPAGEDFFFVSRKGELFTAGERIDVTPPPDRNSRRTFYIAWEFLNGENYLEFTEQPEEVHSEFVTAKNGRLYSENITTTRYKIDDVKTVSVLIKLAKYDDMADMEPGGDKPVVAKCEINL